MKQNNGIFFLGMTFAYFSLFILQAININLLPISIYFFVAWASFELSLLEILKTVSLKLYYTSKKIHSKKIYKITQKVKYLTVLFSYLEYILIFIMAVITPLKNISDNLEINKQLNCLSLLSFSLLFLNIFISQYELKTIHKDNRHCNG